MLLKDKRVKMNNTSRRKKGITLIEAIISVALLSILIVPISGLVINSVKTNNNAQIKQNAAYIGQKALEELKVYDKIKLKDFSGNKGFKMLDGQVIYRQADGSFIGQFTNDELGKDFNVEVKITKNSDFTYQDVTAMDLAIDLTNNNLGNIVLGTGKKIKLVIGLDKHIGIYEDNLLRFEKEMENRNILINITSGFNVNNFSIDVENKDDKSLYIYKNKAEGANDITINTIAGKVIEKVYNPTDTSAIGDLYEIDIEVKKSGKVLFQGSTSSNIVFSN